MPGQRTHPRLDFFEKVRIKAPGDGGATTVFAANLSRGGAFLRTNHPLPPGARVAVQVPAGAGAIVAEGQVVWHKPFEPVSVDGALPGMGVRFGRMSQEARRTLDALVAELEAKSRAAGRRAEDAAPEPGEALDEDVVLLEAPELGAPPASVVAREELDKGPRGPGEDGEEPGLAIEIEETPEEDVEAAADEEVVASVEARPAIDEWRESPVRTGQLAAAALASGLVLAGVIGALLPRAATPTAPGSPPATAAAQAARSPTPTAAGEVPLYPLVAPEPPRRVATAAALAPAAPAPAAAPSRRLRLGAPEIRRAGQAWHVKVPATGPVKVDPSVLAAPARLVLDFEGASLPKGRTSRSASPAPQLAEVRMGRHRGYARVVLEFKGALPRYELRAAGDGVLLTFAD